MKKLTTLKRALENEGLQVRLATLNNIKGTGASAPVLIVNTDYEGCYPDQETVTKHSLVRNIGKNNFSYESRGFYTALYVMEKEDIKK